MENAKITEKQFKAIYALHIKVHGMPPSKQLCNIYKIFSIKNASDEIKELITAKERATC